MTSTRSHSTLHISDSVVLLRCRSIRTRDNVCAGLIATGLTLNSTLPSVYVIAAAMSKPVVADDRKELEDLVLHTLDKHDTIPNSLDFLTQHSLPVSTHAVLISTLQSLQSHALVALTATDHTDYILTAEGEDSEAKGTAEGRLVDALREGGKSVKELEAALGKDMLTIGQGQGMKGKWLQLDKEKGELRLKEGADVKDEVRELLTRVKDGHSKDIDAKVLNELKKRKMIVQRYTHSHAHSHRQHTAGEVR